MYHPLPGDMCLLSLRGWWCIIPWGQMSPTTPVSHHLSLLRNGLFDYLVRLAIFTSTECRPRTDSSFVCYDSKELLRVDTNAACLLPR